MLLTTEDIAFFFLLFIAIILVKELLKYIFLKCFMEEISTELEFLDILLD